MIGSKFTPYLINTLFDGFFTISSPFINISFFSSFVFSLAIEEKKSHL